MDSRPVVFDISSDEDCWGEIRRGGDTAGVGNYYDWISELFERESEDSDDVELVGEVVLNPKPRPKSLSVSEKPWVKDFDDDECMILDGDPDKPVMIEKDYVSDSDELLIVGEKGKIACRDYPHSRHLCAKFPFASTPHDQHCHLCHCYVCDSLAPCVKWGNATSSIGHCHATDKDKFWILRRCNLRQGDIVSPPVPKLPDMSVPTGPLQTIPVPLPPPPPPPPPPPSLLQSGYVAHHQVSRPTTIRACSTSTNSLIPKGRIQQPPFGNSRNKSLPHLVSQHSNIVRRDRSHGVGNLGPQLANSHAVFKRAGSVGVASTTYRSRYTPSNNNHATQYFENAFPMAASNDKYHSRPRDLPSLTSSDTNARQTQSVQSTGSRFWNSVPFPHQISSHSDRRDVDVNSVPSQPVVSSDLNTGSSFVDTVPYPQASSQPTTGSNFDYSMPSQPHVIISQPNMGSSFTNPELSQHQVYSQPLPLSNDSHNGAQYPLDPSFSDFNTTWVDPTGHSIQQSFADNSQIQSSGVTEVNSQIPVRTQQSFADNSQIQSSGVTEFNSQIPVSTNIGSPDFHYDNWMLDNHPVSGALEVPVPSGYVYSPELADLDSDFFDF